MTSRLEYVAAALLLTGGTAVLASAAGAATPGRVTGPAVIVPTAGTAGGTEPVTITAGGACPDTTDSVLITATGAGFPTGSPVVTSRYDTGTVASLALAGTWNDLAERAGADLPLSGTATLRMQCLPAEDSDSAAYFTAQVRFRPADNGYQVLDPSAEPAEGNPQEDADPDEDGGQDEDGGRDEEELDDRDSEPSPQPTPEPTPDPTPSPTLKVSESSLGDSTPSPSPTPDGRTPCPTPGTATPSPSHDTQRIKLTVPCPSPTPDPGDAGSDRTEDDHTDGDGDGDGTDRSGAGQDGEDAGSGADGTNAGLPATGGDATPALLVGGLLIAGGLALVAARWPEAWAGPATATDPRREPDV